MSNLGDSTFGWKSTTVLSLLKACGHKSRNFSKNVARGAWEEFDLVKSTTRSKSAQPSRVFIIDSAHDAGNQILGEHTLSICQRKASFNDTWLVPTIR
jgi:hypothetical protein